MLTGSIHRYSTVAFMVQIKLVKWKVG